MNKKDIAVAFLKTAGSGDVDNAYERYVAKNFTHHNQYFKGDRDSLRTAMLEAHKATSNRAIEVKRTIQEGELVVTHSRVTRADPNAPEIAVVHIFRFEGDKIAELWDLGQPISKDSPNENGPF